MSRRAPATAPSGALRPRRLVLLVAVAILVAAVAGGLLWWFIARDWQATSDQDAEQPSVTLSAARAEEIAAQMTSGEEVQVRLAVVLPVGQPLDPELVPGLAGLQLDIEPDTYTPTGADTATATATATDGAGAVTTWTLNLLLTDDVGWQVLDTVPEEAE
jgi:hypothetical protein